MKKLLLLIAFTIFTLSCKAQNTLHYNDEKGSPKATLNDLKWLSGNWKGSRSSRLNQQYRVIYSVENGELYVHVVEVTPQDYRRRS